MSILQNTISFKLLESLEFLKICVLKMSFHPISCTHKLRAARFGWAFLIF